LEDMTHVGVQAKWFLNPLDSGKIQQIRNSIITAKSLD